jgi:hypothetical protein
MKIKCIATTGEAFANYELPYGFFRTTEFGIEIGQEYTVMGIFLSENLIMYLVDDGGVPQFLPFQLFEIIDSSLPTQWYMKVYTAQDRYYPYRQSIAGYQDLLNDEYLDSLLEQEEPAVRQYFKWKKEIINES